VRGGFLRALAEIAPGVTISQFHGFMFARGCAGGHSRPSHAVIGEMNIRFHCRIPTGIQNFTPCHFVIVM
jgi:hypothetical protein